MTTVKDLDDFKALEPFFRIIEEGLDGLIDGGHFFDLLAEDVIFDFVITVPGYPRHIEGRRAVAELYRPYGRTFFLDRCSDWCSCRAASSIAPSARPAWARCSWTVER